MSADDVYVWANWFLIGSLVVGVVSTYAIVVSGGIRDKALQRELSETNARAAEANARAAEANEKAEQERLARIKIEEKLAPRSFSNEQREKLIAKWKLFAGQAVEVFLPYGSEGEVSSFASQICDVLSEAGWKVTPRGTGLVAGPEMKGVLIFVRDEADELAKTAASNLVSSLIEERFAVDGPIAAGAITLPEPIQVVIGRK